MGYFEYRDLAPIDNIENGDKYIEALNWAFQNKKVKNIALTGPYGAGKSSVIETFIAQDDKKNNKRTIPGLNLSSFIRTIRMKILSWDTNRRNKDLNLQMVFSIGSV